MPQADLVLEGGGVKGIALVGAIEVLEERGYEFKRVAGTSAGAIIGSLVAAGFPAPELVTIMRAVRYTDFKDGGRFATSALGKVSRLLIKQGIHNGDFLEKWLCQQLRIRGIQTFGDLAYNDDERPLPAEKRYRLVVMASDISQGCLRRLPWESDFYGRERSSQDIVAAVRASMSIPFFYKPVRWDTASGAKSWLVDGGLLSNFPIDAFDAPAGVKPRWPTLGIKLSAQPDAAQGTVNAVTGLRTMGLAILDTLTGFYDRMHLGDPDTAARTIFVDTCKIKSTDFCLSKPEQDMLYESGRAAATKFLDGDGTEKHPGWDFERYIATYRS